MSDYGETHYSHTWKVDRGPGDADYPHDLTETGVAVLDPRPAAMLEERYFPLGPHHWNGYLVVDAGGHGDGCLASTTNPGRTLCGYQIGPPSKLTEPECRACARVALGPDVVAADVYSLDNEYPSDDPRRDDDEGWGPWNEVR